MFFFRDALSYRTHRITVKWITLINLVDDQSTINQLIIKWPSSTCYVSRGSFRGPNRKVSTGLSISSTIVKSIHILVDRICDLMVNEADNRPESLDCHTVFEGIGYSRSWRERNALDLSPVPGRQEIYIYGQIFMITASKTKIVNNNFCMIFFERKSPVCLTMRGLKSNSL